MPEMIYQLRGPDVFQQVGNEADVPVQPDVGDVICLRPVHIKVHLPIITKPDVSRPTDSVYAVM
jgi:hypothetical protein